MDGSLSSQEIFVMNKRGISEKMFMVGVVLYRLAKFLLSSHILANCNNWVCQYGLGWCVGWGEHHMWLGCCEAGPVFTSLLLASWLGGGGTSHTQHTTTHPDCAEPVTRSPLLDSPIEVRWTNVWAIEPTYYSVSACTSSQSKQSELAVRAVRASWVI